MNNLETKFGRQQLDLEPVSTDNFSPWLLASILVTGLLLIVGAFALWSYTQAHNQGFLPLKPANQLQTSPTGVVVNNGINGGAGPGSTAITPPVLQHLNPAR